MLAEISSWLTLENIPNDIQMAALVDSAPSISLARLYQLYLARTSIPIEQLAGQLAQFLQQHLKA